MEATEQKNIAESIIAPTADQARRIGWVAISESR